MLRAEPWPMSASNEMTTVAGTYGDMSLHLTIGATFKFFDGAVENFALSFHAFTIACIQMLSQTPGFFFIFGVEKFDHRAGCIHSPGRVDPGSDPKTKIVSSHLAV